MPKKIVDGESEVAEVVESKGECDFCQGTKIGSPEGDPCGHCAEK